MLPQRKSFPRFIISLVIEIILMFVGFDRPLQPTRVDAASMNAPVFDTAPALEETNTIGSVLSPYKFIHTRVRMQDEQVHLNLEPLVGSDPLQSRLFITADFHMYNTSSVTETMQAVFPITDLRCPWIAGPGSWTIREHEVDEESFSVSLVGRTAPTQEITTTTVITSGIPGLWLDCTTKWRSFEVTFPPRQDLSISVAYSMSPGTELAYPWDSFTYILKTGKGWYGSIGQVDISMQLPYPVEQDLILHAPAGYRIKEDTLHWRWYDLEPDQDFKVVALSPQAYQSLAAARERLSSNPQDPQSWAGIAEIYEQLSRRYDYFSGCTSSMSREYYTFPEIQNWYYAHSAVEAYRRALRLNPDSADYRSDLAILLASMSLSANHAQIWAGYPSVQLALRAFDQALALAPGEDASHAQESFRYCMLTPEDLFPKCACEF